MSKRLPYFQFEPAEWLAGDIMFCSFQAQGLYTTLMAIYWQKDCDLFLDQAIKRLKNEELFQELISEKIIKIKAGKIKINFLDEQYDKANATSNKNKENGKKGAEKRWGKDSQIIAPLLNNDSESIALREENNKRIIREEDNNKKNIDGIDIRKLKFSETLKPFLEKYGKDLLNDFYLYWTEPNKSKTKFRQELEKTWSLERRLETWAKNDKNFIAKNNLQNGKSDSNNSANKQQFRFSTSEAIETIASNSSGG